MNAVFYGSKAKTWFLFICILTFCFTLPGVVSATPDTSNVTLTIDNPGVVPGENNYHITFHETNGLAAGMNGFFVTLDPNTTVDDGIDPSCILVSVNGGPSTSVTNLMAIIHNPNPNYSQYNFPDGTTTLKFITPINIPFNSNVRIDILCGLENEGPCPDNGYMVWVNTNLEITPTPSNTVLLPAAVQTTVPTTSPTTLQTTIPTVTPTTFPTTQPTTSVTTVPTTTTPTPTPFPPTGSFTANPLTGFVPLNVQFTDTSINNPYGWAWFFGDETYTELWTNMTVSPGWSARTGHSSVAMPDGSIVLMGGWDIGSPKNDVWRSMDKGETWIQQTPNAGWSQRGEPGSVAMPDGSIVLMGGVDSSGLRNDVWRSTDNGKTWIQQITNDGWSARRGQSSVAMPDGSIVLMGGVDNNDIRNDVWRSTDNGATWTQMTASAGWSARYWHSSVAMPDGSIVLMGGQDNDYIKNDVWRSTDNGATWTQMTPNAGFWLRIAHSSVAMPDGSIVVMGGQNSYQGGYGENFVWRSTDNGATWTQLPDGGWSAREFHSSVAMPDGSIVLMGGQNGELYYNDVWRLNPAGSSAQNPSHIYSTPGIYSVTLQTYNDGGENRIQKQEYITAIATNPAIHIIGITPSSGVNNGIVTITNLSGTGFLPGATVELVQNNQFGIVATNVSVESANKITCTFNLSGAAPGLWEVDVTNPGSLTVGKSIFTVLQNELPSPVQTYNITAFSSEGGTITPSGVIQLESQSSQSFTITPDQGYAIIDVIIDQTSIGPVSEYTFTNVTSNHQILALFAQRLHGIKSTATIGGTISPAGDIPVPDGENRTFSIVPDTGYSIQDVLIDTTSVGPIFQCSFIGVKSDHTIHAIFTQNPPETDFTASPTTGEHPLNVQFTDTSTGNPTTWSWTFGDGTTSSLQNPMHTYTKGGQYSVTLQTTNDGGSDTLTKPDYIIVKASVPKLPGQKNAPTDIDDNGKYEDMNGDGKFDLADVGLYSRYYSTLQRNGQSDLFDYTGDGKIDYRDVLWIVQKYVTGTRRR